MPSAYVSRSIHISVEVTSELAAPPTRQTATWLKLWLLPLPPFRHSPTPMAPFSSALSSALGQCLLRPTCGPLLTACSTRLYGLTCSQTFHYYRLFPKDFTFHKALVSLSDARPPPDPLLTLVSVRFPPYCERQPALDEFPVFIGVVSSL